MNEMKDHPPPAHCYHHQQSWLPRRVIFRIWTPRPASSPGNLWGMQILGPHSWPIVGFLLLESIICILNMVQGVLLPGNIRATNLAWLCVRPWPPRLHLLQPHQGSPRWVFCVLENLYYAIQMQFKCKQRNAGAWRCWSWEEHWYESRRG